MPRKRYLVGARDGEIARRFRDLRDDVGLSQAQLAKRLGVSRSTVGNIEYAAAPLRYQLGDAVCKTFNYSQAWLCSEEGPMHGYLRIPARILGLFTASTPFSTAYDVAIGPYILERVHRAHEAHWKQAEKLMEEFQGEELYEEKLTHLARTYFRQIPASLQLAYYRVLLGESVAFLDRHMDKLAKVTIPEADRLFSRKELQPIYGKRKSSDMTSELPGLLKRVAKLTKARGAKGALAAALGVPQPRISEWLVGNGSPTGEVALRLLRWVEQREEAKTAWHRWSDARPKTRMMESYEETKSGREKR